MRQQNSDIQTWFGWFVDWVKDFVQKLKKTDERKLLVLELLKSRDSLANAESVQRNTPGAVSTWYITHSAHPNSHVLITLDNLFELKKFLKEPLPKDTDCQKCSERTHLVSVQWLIRLGAKQKQIYKFKGAWIADLQGRTASINAKASDVVRYVVMEVLNLAAVPGISWESRLDKYCWEDAITSKCKIIHDKHQPCLKKIRKPDLIGEGK